MYRVSLLLLAMLAGSPLVHAGEVAPSSTAAAAILAPSVSAPTPDANAALAQIIIDAAKNGITVTRSDVTAALPPPWATSRGGVIFTTICSVAVGVLSGAGAFVAVYRGTGH